MLPLIQFAFSANLRYYLIARGKRIQESGNQEVGKMRYYICLLVAIVSIAGAVSFGIPQNLTSLNSSANEISFSLDIWDIPYFASDRTGDYDLYIYVSTQPQRWSLGCSVKDDFRFTPYVAYSPYYDSLVIMIYIEQESPILIHHLTRQ
jgi:hypothetical protein